VSEERDHRHAARAGLVEVPLPSSPSRWDVSTPTQE
jgi:hypothetical protein